MFKYVGASMLGLAAIGFAASAFAAPLTNPWAGDGGEVDVEIVVNEIGEVFTTIGSGQDRNSNPAVQLEITNAGGTIPSGGIAIDTLFHLANVDYEVSAEIGAVLPPWTRFHVLVGVANRGSYDSVFAGLPGQTDVIADTVITWRADGAGMEPPNAINTPIPALTGTPTTSSVQTLVDYAADAIHGLPPLTAGTPITVTWTIASVP